MSKKDVWTDNLDQRILEDEGYTDENDCKTKRSVVDYEKRYREIMKKRLWARVGIVGVSLAALIAAVVICTDTNKIPMDKQSDSIGTLVEVSTLTDNLEYYPKNISTRLAGYTADLSIDVSDTIVKGFTSLDEYSYLGYLNEDQTVYTEIIISKDIPSELELSNKTIEELNHANEFVYESTTDNEYNKIINKAAVNLYDIGYLFVIQQVDSEYSDYTFEDAMIQTIFDTMLYDKDLNNENKLYIELDSFGTYNLYDLKTNFDDLGMYTDETGALMLYDNKEKKDIAMITSINNEFIGDYTSSNNLKQRDGWNNLYETLDTADSESLGYRAFAVQTPRGMYFIQVAKDAPEGLQDDIINLLGILPDDTYIKTIFDDQATNSTEATNGTEA